MKGCNMTIDVNKAQGVNAQVVNNPESKTNKKRVHFRGEQTIGKKSTLTPVNVILGSLATVAVLGMADVLLCKGKHIDKLTGKTQELEEALTRATNAEASVVAAETSLSKLKQKLSELEKRIGNLNIEDGKIRLHDAKPGGMAALRQMRDIYDITTKQSIKDRIKDFFDFNNYELIEYKPEFSDFFMHRQANIPEKVTTIHAIRDKLTEFFLDDGCVLFPMK